MWQRVTLEHHYIINAEWDLLYCLWHLRHIRKFIYTCACVSPGQKRSSSR